MAEAEPLNQRLLVIGGLGFIGCNLAAYYLKQGKVVHVLDTAERNGAEYNLRWLRSLGGRLIVSKGDIRLDQNLLKHAVSRADVVFHMAAQVAVTKSIQNPREDFEINVLGTLNVLEAILHSKKRPVLVYASTNKVYGSLDGIKIVVRKKRYAFQSKSVGIDESQPLDFYSPYGCSKGSADQYVRDFARIYGLRTVVFRQSCIYGERQFGCEDQGWVAWFCIAALLGKRITIYGDGKQVRDVLYISDLIACMDQAVKKIKSTSAQVYNIGGGPKNTLSLLELHELLEKKLRKRIPLRFAAWRPGDQKVYISNISKAWKDFGWEPKVSTEAGVQKLLVWLNENKSVLQRLFSNP